MRENEIRLQQITTSLHQEEWHKVRSYLSARIIAECRDILDDRKAVCLLFDIVEFIRKTGKEQNLPIKQAGELCQYLAKDLMPIAVRIFMWFMEDYLQHFDNVGNTALRFASVSWSMSDFDSSENSVKPEDKERYYRLRERMIAECKNILNDYIRINFVYDIVWFMVKELSKELMSGSNYKVKYLKKKFLVRKAKRKYFYEVRKVVPIAKRIGEILLEDYAIHHQEERINEVYMLAANRLIYASWDKK